jgi:hypothetical protein
MTMKKLAFVLVLAAAACGGKNKNNVESGGDGTIDPNASSGDSTDRSGEQIDPVKMDEVNQVLDRKRAIVSRCLSNAIDSGSAPKGTRGKVTLEIKISQGQATSVEVIKTSIESKEVQDCVKEKVRDIAFPEMKKPYETSYTYAMEAN